MGGTTGGGFGRTTAQAFARLPPTEAFCPGACPARARRRPRCARDRAGRPRRRTLVAGLPSGCVRPPHICHRPRQPGHVYRHDGPPAPQPGDIGQLRDVARADMPLLLGTFRRYRPLAVEGGVVRRGRAEKGQLRPSGSAAEGWPVGCGRRTARCGSAGAVLLGVETQVHGEPPEVEQED